MQKLRSNPNKLFQAAAAAALILLAIAVSLTAYPLPAQAQTLSTDATLSALTVSPKNIIGFSSVRFAYDVGVDSTVTEATITATPTDSNADVSFDSQDSNDVTDGHQVALSAGRNTVTLTVTAEDDVTEQEYTVSVNRGVTDDYGWKADDDLDGLIAAENTSPLGVWGNETTFWVADDDNDKIYAYNMQTKAREAGEDFDTLAAADNADPRGIWSDGITMWVADANEDKLFAYNLSTKARDDAKDFGTLIAANNTNPYGVWSDGITMWVVDTAAGKIYAYNMSDKQRDDTRDFDVPSFSTGIWSDDTTMWVAHADQKIYAYNMSDRQPEDTRDFNTLIGAGNTAPRGIWSDGTTMWVTDQLSSKVFSYNMPPSANANLSSLTTGPKDIIGFDAERTSYEVGVAGSVGTATITAAADHSAATIGFSATDADPVAPGHQVTLSAGRNSVTVTITAEDSSTKEYTVSINRG